MNSGIICATTLLLAFSAQAATAQSNGLPAEIPPASYTANQYVDSNGCAFIRAGIGGGLSWVPRVNRSRSQLCSFQPSIAQTATIVPQPAPASVPEINIAAAPSSSASVGAPIETVASLTTRPTVNRTPAILTPQAVPVVTPQPEARPTTTMAQACSGRYGVQSGFVSSRTGQPIDCGPAPVVASVTPPVVIAPATPRRMTIAQVCAEMSNTGQRYMNSRTGMPVRCGPQTQPVSNGSAPQIATAMTAGTATAPIGAVVPPISATPACDIGISNGMRYLTGGNGRGAVRCGPQLQSPYGTQVARRATAPAALPLLRPTIPASNPVGVAARAVPASPPSGYVRVWGDGRLNVNRGLPATHSAAPVTTISTRSVAPQTVRAPVATTHRYVQVGTFADPANAQRTGQRLMNMGLPVGLANTSRGGVAMKIVVAGPFSTASDLQHALQAARGAGFSDAYTRN